MTAWQEIRLKQLIAEIGDGGTPTTTDNTNFGGDILWAVVDDVVPEIWDTKEKLTEKGFRSCSAKLWPVGSIILTTGATIGQVGIAKKELCTKQGITGIVVNQFANAEFLKYWFEENSIQLLRYAQGTTFKEIRPRALGNLRIKIPNPFTNQSIEEQKAIATLLSKVDKAIKATENSIKAAEKLKKSLMQNLLTGKLKPDGTWRKEDEFYKDEKFGNVPVGWVVKKIKEVSREVQYGLNTYSDEDGVIPMFRMNNIIKGKMVPEPMVYVNISPIEKRKYLLQKGDILFNRTNSMDLVGKVGIFDLEGEYVFASYLIKISINADNDAFFINYLLNSYPIQCNLRSKATPAVSQANINANSIRNTFLLLPKNKAEQSSIAIKLKNLEKSIDDKVGKNIKLLRLKKSLMQNLLTGKVRVDLSKIEKILNEI